MKNLEVINGAVSLIIKSALLAARWSGTARRRGLERLRAMDDESKDKEILFLRDRVSQLETHISILLKRMKKKEPHPRYTIRERMFILTYMETFQIPRRRVTEFFGVARSTLYRWLRRIEEQAGSPREPANKTPTEIAILVWEIARVNVDWGRVRIANQLALLNILVAASTVRNILNRPEPSEPSTRSCTVKGDDETKSPRSVPARYPGHVWSVDTTMFPIWGRWPVHILVAIDHFSRRVMAVVPLEGSNSGCVLDAMEHAFEEFGAPKHIITDQGSVILGEAFAELLESWGVKPRLGAVGMHGSIAVTERVMKTLKHEWLKRTPIIRGFDHLSDLCGNFGIWYNDWRPHMTLDGHRPNDVYEQREIPEPEHGVKTIPATIERRVFPDVRVTGYRLKAAA